MKISHMIRQLGIGSKPKDGLKQIGQHPLPRSQRLRILDRLPPALRNSPPALRNSGFRCFYSKCICTLLGITYDILHFSLINSTRCSFSRGKEKTRENQNSRDALFWG